MVALAACGKEPPEPLPERSVKTITVRLQANDLVRRFPGQVRAAQRATLSFQVGGKVVEIGPEVGDRVRRGAAIARLDPKSFQLRAQQARADRARAEAALAEAERRLEAAQAMIGEGFATRQDVDSAMSQAVAARSALRSAESAIDLATRDVEATTLAAPFDGRLASRTVQPFSEVQAGQVLFEVDGQGAIEVAATVPASLAAGLREGDAVDVRLRQGGPALKASVTSVGRRAAAADAVAVVAQLRQAGSPPPASGAYAELVLQTPTSSTGIHVPLNAVLPTSGGEAGRVFVVGAEATVRARDVKLGPVTAEGVGIVDGLKDNEVIVATGVSFLRDGQKVRLLPEPAR